MPKHISENDFAAQINDKSVFWQEKTTWIAQDIVSTGGFFKNNFDNKPEFLSFLTGKSNNKEK